MTPPSLRVKLIYNPAAGAPADPLDELLQILRAMQAENLLAEVFIVDPGADVAGAVQEALRHGTRLVVVCGGDGTIAAAAAELAGTRAALGILPSGTQNNIALSLGIPTEIRAAAALLRSGRRTRIDMGVAICGGKTRPFLEVCSVGLLSALFPAADSLQRGNMAALGEFVSTLLAYPPTRMRLVLNDEQTVETPGHVLIVGNMPFAGPNFPIAAPDAFQDGLLDVLMFANRSVLELIGSVAQIVATQFEDQGIQRFKARSIEIDTDPAVPILVDGEDFGKGPLRLEIRRRALSVITAVGQDG